MTTLALSRRSRLMFPLLALVILTVVGIGYGPRVFAGVIYPLEMQHWIIRVHVILVSLWLCTFTLQTALAATGYLTWHKRIGRWGFRIGAAWVISALLALVVMLHMDQTTEAESFVLLTRIGIFAWCLRMAYKDRPRPEEHKRWIILGMSQAFIGGIMRLPVPGIHEDFDHAAMLALLVPATLILYDWTTLQRLTRATLWGSAVILLLHVVRVPISKTHLWLATAHAVGRLPV